MNLQTEISQRKVSVLCNFYCFRINVEKCVSGYAKELTIVIFQLLLCNFCFKI